MISLLNKFDDNYVIKDGDILEIVSFYLRSNGLDNYLKDIKYCTNDKFLAYYNTQSNEIELNNEKIWEYCYKSTYGLIKKYNIDEKYHTYFLNFYYISVLFHELTHAMQKQKYESMDSNSLYVYLYDLCRMIGYTDFSFYNKNHGLLPMEIEANNEGLFKAYQLMTYTKLPGREAQLMHLEYLSSLLTNYKKHNNRIISPVERLCKKVNYIEKSELNELLEKTRLSKMQRFNYGLNITTKEYDSLDKEKQKILLRR